LVRVSEKEMKFHRQINFENGLRPQRRFDLEAPACFTQGIAAALRCYNPSDSKSDTSASQNTSSTAGASSPSTVSSGKNNSSTVGAPIYNVAKGGTVVVSDQNAIAALVSTVTDALSTVGDSINKVLTTTQTQADAADEQTANNDNELAGLASATVTGNSNLAPAATTSVQTDNNSIMVYVIAGLLAIMGLFFIFGKK
jgi:hypothetical protein